MLESIPGLPIIRNSRRVKSTFHLKIFLQNWLLPVDSTIFPPPHRNICICFLKMFLHSSPAPFPAIICWPNLRSNSIQFLRMFLQSSPALSTRNTLILIMLQQSLLAPRLETLWQLIMRDSPHFQRLLLNPLPAPFQPILCHPIHRNILSIFLKMFLQSQV